jgi:hypothetical protein
VLKPEGRYIVTPEEKKDLDNFYSILSHIAPSIVGRVLAGHIQSSAPTYGEVLKYIQKLEKKDLDYYKNLYWKSIRGSGKASLDTPKPRRGEALLGDNSVHSELERKKVKTRIARSPKKPAKVVKIKKNKT